MYVVDRCVHVQTWWWCKHISLCARARTRMKYLSSIEARKDGRLSKEENHRSRHVNNLIWIESVVFISSVTIASQSIDNKQQGEHNNRNKWDQRADSHRAIIGIHLLPRACWLSFLFPLVLVNGHVWPWEGERQGTEKRKWRMNSRSLWAIRMSHSRVSEQYRNVIVVPSATAFWA